MPEAQPLVLFDIDGTLLRGAGPHHRDALIAGIKRELGLRTTMDGIATAGTLDRDLIRAMVQSADENYQLHDLILTRITEACEQAYLEGCADDLRSCVCPGVQPLLHSLHAHRVLLGVVSGNLRAIGWKKLELAGLREHFDLAAFSQDGVTRAELAQVAAQRAKSLASTGVSSVTLIGDHFNDVIAAKANRFRAIAVATGVLSVAELAGAEPDLAVADMTALTLATVVHAKKASICEISVSDNRNSSAPTVP